jgi:hypothetical protein
MRDLNVIRLLDPNGTQIIRSSRSVDHMKFRETREDVMKGL